MKRFVSGGLSQRARIACSAALFASGSGDGSIQFAVAANTGPQRTATLTVTDSETTIADTVITITQSAQ